MKPIKIRRELYVSKSGRKYPMNSERECNRRQKQIWLGQIKVENGLKSNEASSRQV